MKTYRIAIEMDTNGWWFVDAIDVPGAHSHGQTLAAARRNIREAIVLMDDDLPRGTDFELDEHIQFPAAISSALEVVRAARAEQEAATARLREATDQALKALGKEYPDLGIRDLAELLGVSYQRIAQLQPGRPKGGRKAAPATS